MRLAWLLCVLALAEVRAMVIQRILGANHSEISHASAGGGMPSDPPEPRRIICRKTLLPPTLRPNLAPP